MEETTVTSKSYDLIVSSFYELESVYVDYLIANVVLEHGALDPFVQRLSHHKNHYRKVVESICAKVSILAWQMMADQHLNARMVVEEIKVGLRVETCDGLVRGFVKCEGLEKPAKELMEGEKGKEVREKVKEIAEAAISAVKEGKPL
ncbi:hypothetical protein RND71_034103 [Anisodus tanguticus]|uniref:Uncharacterized protein n=1 Tax=Anisodus tanguticus TaxID=243964 RepID=A0AAE1RAN0_9SOLA|nr:hypothetical protein RND71_034103 [Anisodus tanguticus]